MKKILMLMVFTMGWLGAQNRMDGLWFIYFGNQQIDKKWNWWTEAQFRNGEVAGSPQQILLRSGVGYNISDSQNVLLGYGYILNYQKDDLGKNQLDAREHRIYQQFIKRGIWGNLPVQHRFRLEERFLKDDFQLRGRYFLGLNVPLTKKNMESNAFYLSLYNEIFLIPQKTVADRNRIYAAIGYSLNKNTRFELGYMNQTAFSRERKIFSRESNQGQLQVAIFNTLNF